MFTGDHPPRPDWFEDFFGCDRVTAENLCRLDVQQRNLELVDQVARLRGCLAGRGDYALEHAGMFLGKKVGDVVEEGH